MTKKKDGNYTKIKPGANAVPSRIVFPLNDFHKRNRDDELMPITDESDAIDSKNFVDHNEK